MRDFFRASPTFWRRGTGKKLRGNKPAQILAWYLMVPPDGGLTGIYATSIPTMAEDTGLSHDEIREALVVLDEHDFAYYDEDGQYVWVVGMAKHQAPEGITSRKDNRWSSVVRELRHAGSHEFVRFFLLMYGAHLSVVAADLDDGKTAPVDKPSSRMRASTGVPARPSERAVEPQGEMVDATQVGRAPWLQGDGAPKGLATAKGGRGEGEEKRAEGEGRVRGEPPAAAPVSDSSIRLARPRDPAGDHDLGCAYADGVTRGSGKPTSKPPQPEVRRLVALVDAHCPSRDLVGRTEWVRTEARSYGEAARDRTRNVYKFGEWFENGQSFGPGPASATPSEPLRRSIPSRPLPAVPTDGASGTRADYEAAMALVHERNVVGESGA